jgi:hypothetical protein
MVLIAMAIMALMISLQWRIRTLIFKSSCARRGDCLN